MVAMAGGAGGRAQIAAHHHGIVVDAGAVIGKLIGGNAVLLHVSRVGVAARTGFGHVDGVHGGTGIAGWPEIVDAMTIGAYGNVGVTSREALSMHAGVVLVQLVGAQTGVELPNIGWIRMATSAQLRDLLVVDLAFPARLSAHGFVWIVAGWVASVATGASQTLLRVDILAELLLAHSQGIRQGGVTIQAGVRGLPITQARCEHDEAGQPDIAGRAERSEPISQDGHKHSYLQCTQEQRRQAQ